MNKITRNECPEKTYIWQTPFSSSTKYCKNENYCVRMPYSNCIRWQYVRSLYVFFYNILFVNKTRMCVCRNNYNMILAMGPGCFCFLTVPHWPVSSYDRSLYVRSPQNTEKWIIKIDMCARMCVCAKYTTFKCI